MSDADARRIGKLRETIEHHNYRYYVLDEPEVSDADEKEIVEDLIVAASADARSKSEKLVEEKAKALTGGLPLPPGMKLF